MMAKKECVPFYKLRAPQEATTVLYMGGLCSMYSTFLEEQSPEDLHAFVCL